MKILHIELGRNFYGGAKQVFYLIKGLSRYGITNILVSPKGSEISKRVNLFLYKNYEVSYKGDLDVSLLPKLVFILKKERPDLIHVHSRKGADIWGGIGAKFLNIPSIITRRVDNPEPFFWARLKYSLYKRVVVISSGIKKVLKEEGVDPKKIVVIPSGIDFKEYQKKCVKDWFIKEFELSEDNLVIGMIAQFIPRKGHRLLINGIPRIIKKHPEVRFLFLGKGPLEPKIKRMVKDRGLSKFVRFGGFREDINKIIPCLYMVVHPAYMEGLGVSLLQASAAGIPIIATDVGGIPEVVLHNFNGYLISPNSVDDIVDKILYLIENRELAKKMGQNGRSLVKKKFSVDKMVSSYINLYREIIENE